jgi:mRNA interferase MazF
MYTKDYKKWSDLKVKLNELDKNIFIRAGEVRWVSLGVNVGAEIDGKGVDFARPCLVLHVSGKRLCTVLPITSKLKNFPGYLELEWKNKKETLCIDQIRSISHKRVFSRIGKISESKLLEIKSFTKNYYSL